MCRILLILVPAGLGSFSGFVLGWMNAGMPDLMGSRGNGHPERMKIGFCLGAVLGGIAGFALVRWWAYVDRNDR